MSATSATFRREALKSATVTETAKLDLTAPPDLRSRLSPAPASSATMEKVVSSITAPAASGVRLALKPAFRIVDWAYWDDETAADPDGALQLQHAAEMSDEIPLKELGDALKEFFDFLDWAKTTWLIIAFQSDQPGTWNGVWPAQKLVLHRGPGGLIAEHAKRFQELAQSGDSVEIRGPCFSACTLIVAYV